MSRNRAAAPVRIGLVAHEPIRLAGLTSIFDLPARASYAQLLPVTGSIGELLSDRSLGYMVVDLHTSANGLRILDSIRVARPDMRLIVIGPAGDEELVLKSILSGARAYLDLHESPEMVRKAIEEVTEGSIWAPRRVLSKLIDRLLIASDTGRAVATPQLTERECEVLELIMHARSNREIAAELGIEERTVRAHLARLMRKAGVDNRIKLSMSARSLFQLPERPALQPNEAGQARKPIN